MDEQHTSHNHRHHPSKNLVVHLQLRTPCTPMKVRCKNEKLKGMHQDLRLPAMLRQLGDNPSTSLKTHRADVQEVELVYDAYMSQ